MPSSSSGRGRRGRSPSCSCCSNGCASRRSGGAKPIWRRRSTMREVRPRRNPRNDMLIVFLSILVQIACAVHCVRGGRNSLWLMVIIFLSLPGCLAYFIFEILPGLMGRREVRAVRQAAVKAMDPEREIRFAREAVETADTAANRIALADTLVALGRWSEAIPNYDLAEGKAPGVDRPTRFKLAVACFEAGKGARARDLLESLPPSGSQSENDRAALLLARLLEEDGEADRELALYADV